MPHEKTGYLTEADLKKTNLLPSQTRFNKGPVVIVECVENIPCNPCVAACPRKSITMPGKITNLPQVNFETCNGCTLCIAKCPGLAIFVVHKNYNKNQSAISLPYEFLPRPQKGDKLDALDRQGKFVCQATVEKVLDSKALDRCAVVTIIVPKKYYNKVRFIKEK